MAQLLVFTVLCFGLAVLWAIHEHNERRIAAQGYDYYIRFSRRWKRKRKACLKRFGYRCALCNSPLNLEAHHRTYARLFHEKTGDLICLCRSCHERAPRSKGLYKG